MRSLKSTAGDIELRERVLEELEWDPRIDPSQLHVHAKDGALSLRGTVTTYSQRLAAVRAAERVRGVKAVADDIEVVLARDVGKNDSELAAEIARERTWNIALPATVDVEVRSGHVVLDGYVGHAHERDEAERAVRHLVGVQGLTNSIEVRPHPESSAEDIEGEIESAIERSAVLEANAITVTKSDGVVRLEGTVHSIAERKTAQRVAESAAGVAKVENHIVVE
jgi:osmotically-inducible protein OsmY